MKREEEKSRFTAQIAAKSQVTLENKI